MGGKEHCGFALASHLLLLLAVDLSAGKKSVPEPSRTAAMRNAAETMLLQGTSCNTEMCRLSLSGAVSGKAWKQADAVCEVYASSLSRNPTPAMLSLCH